jgi:hypothetical protein
VASASAASRAGVRVADGSGLSASVDLLLVDTMVSSGDPAVAETLVYAPKVRAPMGGAYACFCGQGFSKLKSLTRHKKNDACGTGQTQQRKAPTEEQNAARAKTVREARAAAVASPPFVNLQDGAVRGVTLTGPLLQKVCLGLTGLHLDASVEPAAWLLIRCAGPDEPSSVRQAAEHTETHAALQHIEYLPRGACVAVAQVRACSPVSTGYAIAIEQVVVLRHPLAYAHTREGSLWTAVPAVLRKLEAQTKSTTFVCSGVQNANTAVGVTATAIAIGRIWKAY